MIPGGSDLKSLVSRSLRSLEKQKLRYHSPDDSYCLTREERLQNQARSAQRKMERESFINEARSLVSSNCATGTDDKTLDLLTKRVIRVIENYLFERGEHLLGILSNQEEVQDLDGDLKPSINSDLSENPLTPSEKRAIPTDIIVSVIIKMVGNPAPETITYLSYLSDVYTIFSLTKKSVEARDGIKKMFSGGNIWLDANILIPLLIERLIEDKEKRHFSKMLLAANEIGLNLHVIRGVLEEVDGHIQKSLACARTSRLDWHGGIPYLFSSFLRAGYKANSLSSWVERIRGDNHPVEDLLLFLQEEFHITERQLDKEVSRFPDKDRWVIQEIWREIHEKRIKNSNRNINESRMKEMIDHDLENYLGVLQRRLEEGVSALGKTSWWLTFDQGAFRMRSKIREHISRTFDSPVMSMDFFSFYLHFGPMRHKRKSISFLPIIRNHYHVNVPPDIKDLAERTRAEFSDLEERIIQRRVRDKLEQALIKEGYLTNQGPQLNIESHARSQDNDNIVDEYTIEG